MNGYMTDDARWWGGEREAGGVYTMSIISRNARIFHSPASETLRGEDFVTFMK